MTAPTGFYISSENLEWCQSKVSEGWFASVSDTLDFALRIYLIQIRNGMTSIEKFRRSSFIRRNARVNEWVLNELMATGVFTKSEIADYALTYLRSFMDGKENIGQTI